MFFVKLAFRNVFRQYGRTTLSMVSIVFGVAVIILGRGFVSGTNENMIRAQIDSASGHVLVRPKDYPTVGVQHPIDELIELDTPAADWLDANAMAWTRRTIFVARAVRGQESLRVRVFGFDPATDSAVFPRDNWKVDGKIPETADDGVLLCRGVARIFEAKPGDTLIFEARTADGALNALEIPVSGILGTGNPAIDRMGSFMPKPLVERLVLPGERFSHLAIRLDDRGDTDAVAASIAKRMGETAEVRTWSQEVESLLEIQKLRQRVLDFIAFILMGIAAAGIANTVLMAAYERIREIGTLRALGLTRQGVVGLLVAEGAVMGVVGSAAGALFGGGVVRKYSIDGIDMSAMIESAGSKGAYDNIPFSSMLYMEFSPEAIAGAMVFGFAVAVLASIYPAVIASRMAPADAVRAE